MSAFHDGT
jgi:transcriptional regulator with XRE-family HTH domain